VLENSCYIEFIISPSAFIEVSLIETISFDMRYVQRQVFVGYLI